MWFKIALLVSLVFSAFACERNSAKREAKKRVFAPPPPDPVIELSKEKIALEGFVSDKPLQERVIQMPFSEIGYRLNSLQFVAQGSIKVSRGDVKRVVKQKSTIGQNTSGDFELSVVMEGGDEQHIVYSDGLVFIRHNKGRWRASRDPADERLGLREEAYRLWPSYFDLFRSGLKFGELKATTHNGRPVLRSEIFVVASSEGADLMPGRILNAPADEDEKGKARRMAQRAEEWRRYSEPKSGGGELLIDEQKGVVLKVSFSGTLVIHDSATQPARCEISVSSEIKDIGEDIKVKKPEDYVEEYVRRKIVTNPLYFLDDGHPNAPKPKAKADDPATSADTEKSP